MSGCEDAEVFALRVVGRSMAPEFDEGDVIVVEPGGAIDDGAFVVARHQGEWIFRQLRRAGDGWVLHALDAAWPDLTLASLDDVRGVVIQKAVPGRRRATRNYIPSRT